MKGRQKRRGRAWKNLGLLIEGQTPCGRKYYDPTGKPGRNSGAGKKKGGNKSGRRGKGSGKGKFVKLKRGGTRVHKVRERVVQYRKRTPEEEERNRRENEVKPSQVNLIVGVEDRGEKTHPFQLWGWQGIRRKDAQQD